VVEASEQLEGTEWGNLAMDRGRDQAEMVLSGVEGAERDTD